MSQNTTYGKKEFRLGARSISLPLNVYAVFENSGLVTCKDGDLQYKALSFEDIEWAKFLKKEAIAYVDWCDEIIGKLAQEEEELKHNGKISQKARYNLDTSFDFIMMQKTCAIFLSERAHLSLQNHVLRRTNKSKEINQILELERQLVNKEREKSELQFEIDSLTAANNNKLDKIKRLEPRLIEVAGVNVTLKAENDQLRAKVAELENATQKGAEAAEKPIDKRERKTLLRLIHAALSLEKKKSVDDRSLAGLLAAKSQTLYPETAPDSDTIKKKLNEIIALHKEETA